MTDLVVAAPRRRLRSDDRRHQLLDTAATLVVAHGAASLSMERLAAAAGVSKALPYKHYDNIDAVLVDLYRREVRALGTAVWDAMRATPARHDLTRVAIRTYFDQLALRRDVLAALTGPGSTIGASAGTDRVGVAFEADVLVEFAGLDRRRADEVAGIVQGAIVGAASAWSSGRGRRQRLEDDLVWLIDGLLRRR
ncbi:MAG: TetR/AcrR family transcriptional regulator [Acidimicrobiales bacterium]|nr:TetR/AcrR family transcriptional regulator [Acidimicrobiales bacterium]MCB9395955.1 TetR/AcrR family transcriptional regulator [Acidimicrobiaceae bacterium]